MPALVTQVVRLDTLDELRDAAEEVIGLCDRGVELPLPPEAEEVIVRFQKAWLRYRIEVTK